uniref:Butyrophilin-like protein 1 n=1 Tax=Sparus aurata TaxID=8175 RepID=A0A671UH75_SPAAU
MELLPLVCLCLLSCSGAAVKVVVDQDSDAVLPCSPNPKVDLTGQVFDWKKGRQEVFMHNSNDKTTQGPDFIGRVSHFQDQLQNGDASIKIRKTKMADNGTYSCIFPHLQSQTFYITLVVGASKPSVKTIKTDDGMVLQCEVLGASPKPKVEWKDGSGNILPVKDLKETENGGLYDIVLQAAVTKSDDFRCVVTQEEISHQTEAETYSSVNGAAAGPGSNTGLVTLWFLVLLLLF